MPVDPHELTELIEKHAGSLRLWIRSRCASPEDVVQEALCKLADQNQPPLNPVAWLYRVCKHNLAAVMILSPRETWPELAKLYAEQKSIEEQTETKANYFDRATLFFTLWSLKRKIQAQRIVEAVRHHLATHEGKLPASLNEIKDVPNPDRSAVHLDGRRQVRHAESSFASGKRDDPGIAGRRGVQDRLHASFGVSFKS